MIVGTVSSSWPPGSATGQSTFFTPGTYVADSQGRTCSRPAKVALVVTL